jgi:hypothetical protein
MDDFSLILKNDWERIWSFLSSLTDLGAQARTLKAFRRRRGVDSEETLLRLCLGYGAGQSLRQASAWAETTDVARISTPALLKRLSNAADWLEQIARLLLEEAQAQPAGEWVKRRIRLVDATSLSCPGAKGTTWRLHVSYDATGRIDDFQLSDKRGTESLARFAWSKDDIAIADRGYAKPKDLRKVIDAGGDLVVRTGWNALRLTDAKGGPFDLFAAFKTVGEQPLDVSANVDTREKGRSPLPVRLLIARLPEDKVKEAHKKIKAKAARQGKKTDPRTLKAAGYVIVLTSLPKEYCAESILKLYRLRWQIELLFKRMKSLLDFGDLPAKGDKLAKAWIFSKLIIALLADKMARQVAESPPSAP